MRLFIELKQGLNITVLKTVYNGFRIFEYILLPNKQ